MTDNRTSLPAESAQLSFFGLSFGPNDDLPLIHEGVERHAGPALDVLYAKIASDPKLGVLFRNPAAIEHARSKQLEHWSALFTQGINGQFMQGAEKIGLIHARVGLDPVWYIGAYAMVLDQVIDGMMSQSVRRRLSGKALTHAIGTFVKTALFDMQLALSSYFKAANEERAEAIGRIGQALSALADGDLDNRLSGLSAEYRQIEQDFEQMRVRMRETLTEVADASEMIRVSSSEIAHASSDLAERTEKQAANVEETAAAMEQITATVKQTASRANEVRSAVQEAQHDAGIGAEVVQKAVGAMADIERSSSEIAQIVTLIDGIAFQTNLLALNAGVEAARAGDAGMGFAVVANEVRALAQRSADAAKNIKDLIGSSSAQVTQGVHLVGETGEALSRIAGRIGQMNLLATEIASTADAQAQGIAEVNVAVNSMDRSTQQNAAMVEEATAAANSLSTEATRLSGLVGRFALGEGGRSSGNRAQGFWDSSQSRLSAVG
ncbi:globin-coupled sensor protein [Rhizorhabdus phycosphaerae]|uniref:globin-coupled sensor protein n=1 Tax=Rhizorhabdus phycosphaerae TaxID=2711156 RepID=UPI0013ECC6A9|nr:globin-coupled sensor protein [Rhizorhabdus phycosphaerae]